MNLPITNTNIYYLRSRLALVNKLSGYKTPPYQIV